MKIRIIEYKCIVNEDNKPFGHGDKVMHETIQICKHLGYDVEVASSSAYLSKVEDNSLQLPNNIPVTQYCYHNIHRIFQNIRRAVQENLAKDTLLWFTNVDWYLFLYLGLFHIKNKIIVTTYTDRKQIINQFRGKKLFVGEIIARVIARGIKKTGVFFETFYTNMRMEDAVYLPDYIYKEEYDSYRVNVKENRVLCIGTMNEQKDIEGLITAFQGLEQPLLIIGEFANKVLLNRLQNKLTDNIKIIDKFLEYKEYCDLIAHSKYVITPYNMKIYGSSTSGVLREALYMGTQVIAPHKMLANMGIRGLGYNELSEVRAIFESEQSIPTYENDLEEYRADKVLENIRKVLNQFVLL